MRVLFDTSTLVAAMVGPHPMHHRVLPWLQQAHEGQIEFSVASHTLAELYAVLTRLPVRPRMSPGTALRLIGQNVESQAKIISLTPADYGAVIRRMAELGVAGGAIYDALIARAAYKIKAERLLTLNPDDFKRVWPEGADRLSVP